MFRSKRPTIFVLFIFRKEITIMKNKSTTSFKAQFALLTTLILISILLVITSTLSAHPLDEIQDIVKLSQLKIEATSQWEVWQSLTHSLLFS